MNPSRFVSANDLRARFSRAMSDMYRTEVPQYGALLELVDEINAACLRADPALRDALVRHDEMARLGVERHGAIRLGTAAELSMMRRVFAVMGMYPVGYYDLSVAGIPVHSTAFRPIDDDALRANPFRVFTSLLRLELVADAALREQAAAILARRRIFSERVAAMVAQVEAGGGFTDAQADEFVREVRETFRWHSEATVDAPTYRRLHDAHRLVSDVVSFKGPHINHLTPRALDIDAAQAAMPLRGIQAKKVIEGPPRRRHPILLRQTSFAALEEVIAFPDAAGAVAGSHTARFGEIEQRGMALTPAGRALYDDLLARAQNAAASADGAGEAHAVTQAVFAAFPDDLDQIRVRGLAFFRYAVKDAAAFDAAAAATPWDLERLLREDVVDATPIIYEDFLPVSAAGIFRSNLAGMEQRAYDATPARSLFEACLGDSVIDEMTLYERAQTASVAALQASYRAAGARHAGT